jgi:membrane fusion protein (multidrug efflux system)
MNVRTVVFFIGFSLITLKAAVNAAGMSDSGLDCIIEPSSTVNAGSEVPGIIEEITVDRGDIVKKGQVLVMLDSKVERAVMESKKARYEFAISDHKRKSGLYAKAMIPTRDFDESETNLKVAQRDLEEAEKVYERRTIRSPIDGVVVQRLLQPGERVEQEPILKLAQLSPLYVEVIAPVSMLGSVKAGDRVAVRPENPVKGEYIGGVKIVDNVVDAASGTFGIRIELENKDYSLPSGLKCKVRFLGKDNISKKPSRAHGASPQNSTWPKQDAPAALPIKQPLP